MDRFRAGDPTKRGGRYKSEFIWNSNWQEQMDFEEAEKRRAEEAAARPAEPKSGFLSFGRLAQLGSMEDDLSDILRPRPQQEAQSAAADSLKSGKPAFDKIKATHGEQRRWQRQDKFNRIAAPRPTAPPTILQDLKVQSQVKAEESSFDAMKGESMVWSLALCVICSAAVFYFYNQDIAASYVLGAAGGLVYLRMLHKHLDNLVGGNPLGGFVSSQRLLVPIIMVMAFNRWNTLAADRTGITLQLLPVLVGFFTYKGALVARQSVLLFDEINGKRPAANKI